MDAFIFSFLINKSKMYAAARGGDTFNVHFGFTNANLKRAKRWCRMCKALMIGTLAILLLGGTLWAQTADVSKQQMDAAYARLQKAQAAATQPATITNADLSKLRAELASLRSENARLKVEVTKLEGAHTTAMAAAGNRGDETQIATKEDPSLIPAAPNVQYDRFKDVTSVETPRMNLMMMTEPNGERITDRAHRVVDWSVEITFTAVFDGKQITGKSPSHVFAIVASDSGIGGNEMNFLADDVHLKAKITDSQKDAGILEIDATTMKTIGLAKKVEGQLDRIEFVFSPAQIAAVNKFCKTVYPEK